MASIAEAKLLRTVVSTSTAKWLAACNQEKQEVAAVIPMMDKKAVYRMDDAILALAVLAEAQIQGFYQE